MFRIQNCHFVGIVVFAGDYDNYVSSFSGTNSWRRWGYWIFTAVIVLLVFSTILFPFKFFFDKCLLPRLQQKQKYIIIIRKFF